MTGAGRKACLFTLMCLLAFVIALGLAVLVYPGGSWTDPRASGFSWVRNYFCDLLRDPALGGAPNLWGSRLSRLAFAALALGLWPFWWVAASIARRGRRVLGTWLGLISAAGVVASAVLSSDRYPVLHGAVALSAGLLGCAAAWLCLAAPAPGEPRWGLRRVSGFSALGLSLLHAALHARAAYWGAAESWAEPLVQKFAAAALLVWMLVTIRAAWLVAARQTG